MNSNIFISQQTCHSMNMKIFVKGDSETYTFCGKDNRRKPIIALNDVNITLMVSVDYENMIYDEASTFSFRLQFTTGNYLSYLLSLYCSICF